MGLMDRFRRRGPAGPEGVAVRVRPHNRPPARGREAARGIPRPLLGAVALVTLFYLLAHFAVVEGVWPVHGSAPRSGAVLVRDLFAMLAWLLLFPALRIAGYRGNWAVVALPILIFFLTRPSLFQLFTDPVYQATGETRGAANAMKAERAQITTILRAYDEERQAAVFQGPAPEIPDPIEAIREATREERSAPTRLFSAFSVILAPAALFLAFLAARRNDVMRVLRERRLVPYALVLGVFLVMVFLPGVRTTGKLAGTTPWELFLPVFVGAWAATLGDDAYNLARPGAVVSPRRMALLVFYGALPLVPLLLLHELGLSVVLAGSLATMLLVGTRRGWWAGLMLVVWAGLVFAAFNLDDRSQTRLALAVDPYRDLSAMTEAQAEEWGARVHQIKLFDANILAGGVFGEGVGRGHAETAPNAADDGYITTIAAQWGLLGGISLVMLYTAFLIQMLGVAVRERSAFERSLVTGLAMLLAIPFWLATLGGMRVIPLTGVAAAFAAHGGAKLLASAIAVGIVAGVSQRRAEADRLADAADPGAAARAQQGVRIR